MIQQVNLYQASYSWEDDALPAAMVLKIVGAAAALFLVLWLVDLVRTSSVTSTRDAQAARMQELQAQLAEYSERAGRLVSDNSISSRVTELHEQLASKRRLLEALSSREAGNDEGFSSHLTGLARQTVDGVWLRSIAIGKGGHSLMLSGSTLSATAVPDLLQRLGEAPAFSGRQFRTFRLELSEARPDAIDFVLATEAEVQ